MKTVFFILLLFAVIGSAQETQSTPARGTPIGVREFFADFPAVKMGMSFAAAKRAVTKSGNLPVTHGSVEQIVWDSKFAGVEGRATMLFKPKTGAWEIAVVVYAMEEQAAILKKYREKIELRHGPATEIHDDEYAISYVWRFRDRSALELRAPKDVNSPIVDIHWVRE